MRYRLPRTVPCWFDMFPMSILVYKGMSGAVQKIPTDEVVNMTIGSWLWVDTQIGVILIVNPKDPEARYYRGLND